MKRVIQVFALSILISAVGVLGFFVREYLQMREEYEGLRALTAQSLEFSTRQADLASSCMNTLNSCAKLLGSENPQIRDSLLQVTTKRLAYFQQERGQ